MSRPPTSPAARNSPEADRPPVFGSDLDWFRLRGYNRGRILPRAEVVEPYSRPSGSFRFHHLDGTHPTTSTGDLVEREIWGVETLV